MYRNVTAIYRTHSVAELVRQRLGELGISRGHITVIPDTDVSDRTTADYADDLRDLHLPDDDLRTYEQAVRRGDHVVSVEVDDDTYSLEAVREVMRHPENEAYDLDQLGTEFGSTATITPVGTTADEVAPDYRGVRDPYSDDPYTRAYSRRGPLQRDNR